MQPLRRPLRLLYLGDASLAQQCLQRPGGSIEVVEAGPGATKCDLFDVLLIEHGFPGVETFAILKNIAARKLHIPVVIVADWDEALAVHTLKLGAVDYVAKSNAAFRAVFFRLNRLIAHSALLNEQSRLRDALAEAEASHRAAEQLRLAEAAASADRLAQQHAEFTTGIARAVRARLALERRMSDALSALEQARQDRTTDAAAAAELLAQREDLAQQLAEARSAHRRAEAHQASEATAAETRLEEAARRLANVEAELAREVTNAQALAKALSDVEIALHHAEQQHASEMGDAAARFAESQERADLWLAQAAAATSALEAKLADTAAALERVERQAVAERQAASEETARRLATFEAELAVEVTNGQALARALADTEAALHRAEQQHASEMSDAVTRLAATQERADTSVAQAVAAADALECKLADTAAALERVERQAATERNAAAEDGAQRQAEFDAELATAVTNGQALSSALAAAEFALRRAEHQHTSEMAEAAAASRALECRLADTAAALESAQRHASADRQAAIEEAARRHANFEAELASEVTNAQALATALADAEAALQRAEQQHASEMADAAARLSESQENAGVRLAQSVAAAEALESTLADTASALERIEREAAADRQAAAEEAARRRAEFAAEIAQNAATRQALEQALADSESARRCADEQHASETAAAAAALRDAELVAAERQRAAEQAEHRFLDEVAAMRQSAGEREARLEERAARERAEFESTLVATEEQFHRLEGAHREERADLERARITSEADLARQCADHATERARFEALVAERDTQLLEQAARKQASDEAAAKTLADVEHHLGLALAAGNRDSRAIAQLHEQLKAVGDALEATISQCEVLKIEADRVPQLARQIDDIRAENRQRFESIPVSMFRCGRDGAITQASRALAGLLGYDTPEEVQQVDFAGTVFESGDELQWIVDRCLASRSTESVETTWKRKDGSRVIVRVLAVATTTDTVDLAAQDITSFRVLEEKLRNSQRLEAVARFGSEVAVNCDNLLRHVKQEGQQWLARIDSDAARYHGELLLDEVTRAAGLLRQLRVYGNEQRRAPELVDVNKVLRDLAPVLKRVAGGNVELVLPKVSTPLNLDVEAERVERMLVNVAAYGRERMPLGGRLMIEVDSVVVDREFVARYPNVRPGAHVLLTVNEVRGAARPDSFTALRTRASAANAITSAPDKPGVDLGALQALVTDCGGHLWMTAEPPGDMMLKIHLPRRVLDTQH